MGVSIRGRDCTKGEQLEGSPVDDGRAGRLTGSSECGSSLGAPMVSSGVAGASVAGSSCECESGGRTRAGTVEEMVSCVCCDARCWRVCDGECDRAGPSMRSADRPRSVPRGMPVLQHTAVLLPLSPSSFASATVAKESRLLPSIPP